MSAERKVFGKLQGMATTPPDLIEIQTKSYQDFLQADVPPAKRENKGLQAIFNEIFPISSYDGRFTLDFVSYNLGEPKKSYLAALMDGETYSRPLQATFRLKDGEDVREDEVFLGRDYGHAKNYSETTATAIDREVKEIILNAHARTEKILTEHMDKMDELVLDIMLEKGCK